MKSRKKLILFDKLFSISSLSVPEIKHPSSRHSVSSGLKSNKKIFVQIKITVRKNLKQSQGTIV